MKINHFAFDGVVAKGFAAKNWMKAIMAFLRLVMNASITKDIVSLWMDGWMDGEKPWDITLRGTPHSLESDGFLPGEWEFRAEFPSPENFRPFTEEESRNVMDLEELMIPIEERKGVSIPRSPDEEIVRGNQLVINLSDEIGGVEGGFLQVEGALLRLCYDPAISGVTIHQNVCHSMRVSTLTFERRRDGGLDLSGDGIPDGYSKEEKEFYEDLTQGKE